MEELRKKKHKIHRREIAKWKKSILPFKRQRLTEQILKNYLYTRDSLQIQKKTDESKLMKKIFYIKNN